MNHTIRLYHDRADLVEHASEEIAKKAYVEETGLRDQIVVLGLSTDGGALAARTFHNRKPGMPIPGALLQVIGGAAALEFAVDSVGMLDRLNALPMVDGDAFLFLGDGATFHRSLQPVTLDLGLTFSEDLLGDGLGERLPDFDPDLLRTSEGSGPLTLTQVADAAPEGTTTVEATTEATDTTDTSAPAEGTTDATDAAPEGTTVDEAATEGSDITDTSAPAQAAPATSAKKRGK